MYAKAVAAKPVSWDQVEDDFLRAMERFDANVTSGVAVQADWQNGKGDFLNDLIALLLENCAGLDLLSRRGIPGLIVGTHNLDITYPGTGIAQFLLEAKALGNPKHPRNPSQKNSLGRPGSSDIPKRIRRRASRLSI